MNSPYWYDYLGEHYMEKYVIRKQNIYVLKDKDLSLFYNSQNGKLALAKDVSDLIEDFFSQSYDTVISCDETQFEQLYLAVSESCNYRCKYCRQDKSNETRIMSIDEIKNAIDIFFKHSKSPKSVVFFGGEPLLNYIGIKFAIEYINQLSEGIKYSMVTNGSLCTKEYADFFSHNHVEVIVSLDGPEWIHNKARINKSGRGTYDESIRGYNLLKESGCVTGLTTVIGPHNENHFNELVDWAIDLSPNSLGFCLPHGDSNNYAMRIDSFDNVHKHMIEAYEYLNDKGIYLVQVEQKIRAFILGLPIPYECKACGRRIVACKDNKFGICEGPITNDGAFSKDINDLLSMVNLYKKSSPFAIPSCGSCIAYRVCGGSCVYDKLTRFGRPDIPDTCRCGLNVLISKKAMTIILQSSALQRYPHIISTSERQLVFNAYNKFA